MLTSQVVYCLIAFRRLASIVLVAILKADVEARASVVGPEVVDQCDDLCRT